MALRFHRWPLLLGLAAPLLGGCASLDVQSQWRRAPIVVDGQDQDWIRVDSDKLFGLTVKAANDADALYLCISADDPALKRQLGGGQPWSLRLTRQDGAQFSLEVAPHRSASAPAPPLDPLEDPSQGVSAAIIGVLPNDQERRDVYWSGPSGAAVGPLDPDRDGVELADHDLYGTQVVEIKLPLRPLRAGAPALGCAPGDSLGLRLELPPPDPDLLAWPSRGPRRRGPAGDAFGPWRAGGPLDAADPLPPPPAVVAAVLEGRLWLARSR